MANNQAPTMKLRCPVCYARENDVNLLQAADGSYYCVKCSYTGTEAAVREIYAQLRAKYRLITQRITLDDLRKK